jgi:parvulin-like peptidyl-prolyl isomerase
MMMRSIRANTKWIMLFLAVAFAGWLVFDWVQSRDSAAATGLNPVIAVVNGHEIRYTRWSQELEVALQRARGLGDAPLTDEESRQVERQAWDDMINNILIEQEIDRLGIQVTDAEVRQAFRVSPPPDLMQHPAFQSDGQFDYNKYLEFFSDPAVDEQLLLQIENYYRVMLPRIRLNQLLSQGGAVSDAQVWREFRDRNETATVTYISVDPATVTPDELEILEDELRSYYADHRDDFLRPATATINIVSFSTTPSSLDSLAARATADSVRAEIAEGRLTFEDAAASFSADDSSAPNAGALGRFGRGDLLATLEEAAFALDEGETSEPVLSPRGYHLLRASDRTSDSVTIQHILLPIRLTLDSEDVLFDQMDSLEGFALIEGLQVGADSTGTPISKGVTVTEGFDFVPGAGALGVAVDWALDPITPLDEVSEFFRNATGYHILEVVERVPSGTFSFDDVRDQIRQILAAERRSVLAMQHAAQAMDGILSAASMEEAGQALGWPVDTAGPFTRREFVAGLGRDTEAVGAAFGMPVGNVEGPFDAGDAVVILRVDKRIEANILLFETMKEQLRAQLMLQAGQTNPAQWLAGLRERADVVDRRDRLNRQVADA